MSKGNAPEVVPIYFEYENSVKTAYLILEMPEMHISRVASTEVYECLQGLSPDTGAFEATTVAMFIPTQHGWALEWRITAKEFLERSQLVEIKHPDQERLYQ